MEDKKSSLVSGSLEIRMPVLLFVSILFAIFAVSLSDQFLTADWEQLRSVGFGSSILFPVKGNVYPLGHFTVSVTIGNPPKAFELDIDTGSDLTWVQCDVQCTGCTLPRDMLYKPHNNAVSREDPLCAALSSPGNAPCKKSNDQCDYDVEYADHGSSIGVLVKDLAPMRLTNGQLINPNLGFGCGYDQDYGGMQPPPLVAGVLGLSSSKATIVSQLNDLGHVSNVIGHCLAGLGGGFLFFGGGLVPSSGMSWTPILRNSEGKYSSGPAEVYFGGKAGGIKGLTLTFDSGSSYTYFNSQVYGAVEKLLKNDLKGQPLKLAPDDKTLELCWKGRKAFKSVSDVRDFFKPLALNFKNSKNAQFQIPPEAYLIISPRDKLYKPHNNVVRCGEPLCTALFHQGKPPCRNPNDQCDYQIEYADHGSSIGVLVKDLVPMKLANGTVIAPNLGFGCGYDQHNGGSQPPPSTGGVLGLGNSRGTLASQISSLTHVRNIIGHCYSGHGGGFLFFGGDLVPSSGISWTPILHTSGGRYSSGPADVFFGGKAVGIRGLTLTFDSGSSYTYFNSQVYGAILNRLRNDLKGQPLKDAPEEKILPVCWKGSKAFKSVADVRSFFKPLALSFTNSQNVQFQMPPESYLIISESGNVCLGILDGSQVGLGNVNLIGDISFLDKIVVYDNEKQRIGWAPANCSRPRKQ
ncbi:aspartic proteinase Asp1-like isoform X1 [Cucurbita moschata]|uniref:Aspartic proteinase Asp1 n=1 Tax=Cucurbita moschata TaxID=3662 RepID=A0A6J1F7L0_CUCMO|nr:aspartic proteinase Asp1-like isoform X1 [Cucurbita moschata]